MITGNKHNIINVDALHKYHTGINTPSISEELVNRNVKSFKAGTSNVNGVDLTNQMEQSLVTLDGIEGKTEITNNPDPTLKIKNTQVKLLYTLDENDTTNYFNDKSIISGSSDTTCTLDGNNIRVTTTSSGWRCVDVEIYGLEPGCVYRLYVDDVQITRGGSAISVDSDMNGHLLSNIYANHSTRPNFNSNGLVVKARNNKLKFYFYVNLGEDSQGDVSYNGITLRKVKEYTCADLTLRSLPNGVKDEIKNNKLIKRIQSYTLNGTEDWVLADGTKANTNSFSCPLPNAVPVNKAVVSINSNKYKNASDEELYLEDVLGLAIGGLNSNKLMFRVGKGLDSVGRLKEHLSKAERDITIEYEIKEEVYDIDLVITCPPGETVFIDTNDNLTFSHQVQLNTKAQVEETQNKIQQTKKSIWQKFKELTDVEMKLEGDGYIKLPTALGGLTLQWFVAKCTLSANTQVVRKSYHYPYACSTFSRCFATIRDSSQGAYTDFICAMTEGGTNSSGTLEVRRSNTHTSNIDISATIFIVGK